MQASFSLLLPNRSLLALIFSFLCVCLSMLFFPRTMYYSVLLLCFRVFFLYYLSSSFCVSVLFYLLVCIVYIGAMIILIGYICAISPNVYLEASFSPRLFLCILLLAYFLFIGSVRQPISGSLASIREYFYSSFGAMLFFVLVSFLFFTLLIVTSYYLSRKGPFRSVRV